MSIFSKGEPICIEVFLGPENNAILLEQWTIRAKDETSGGLTMSMAALCSAIRSQLHFSQVTAWTDLLRNASPFDVELKSNPRIKNISKTSFRPKLDILYRIRSYDSTSCFTSIPIEHNFPKTLVGDQMAVQVSLKSLSRMKGIPHLSDFGKVPSPLAIDESVQPMILDDRPTFACTETGKHRCTIDEESPNEESLSHRDKQLLKYKKRMMRRDRKKREENAVDATTMSLTSVDTTAKITNEQMSNTAAHKSNTLSAYDQSINPNRPPLYSSSTSTAVNASAKEAANQLDVATKITETKSSSNEMVGTTSKATQTAAIEMISVSTQTEAGAAAIDFANCDFCGIEMQYFCWNCDKNMFSDVSDAQNLSKSDLLLRSIQRTPSNKQQLTVVSSTSTETKAEMNNRGNGNGSDCRSCCKRQKTVHNYTKCDSSGISADDSVIRTSSSTSPSIAKSKDLVDVSSSGNGYRRTMSESVVGACHFDKDACNGLAAIDLSVGDTMNVLSDNELKLYRRAYSEDELICNCDDNRPKPIELSDEAKGTAAKCSTNLGLPDIESNAAVVVDVDQFKTPQTKCDQQPLVGPIYIRCPSHDDDRSLDAAPSSTTKHLPKINLTKLFASSSEENIADSKVDNVFNKKRIALPTFSLSSVFDFENLSPPMLSPATPAHSLSSTLVQKSNSAPNFNHSSPMLSPRILKAAATSKRRSRHLSDRSSERLSIGSDDHLSDEEFHQYCIDAETGYRPGISPTKASLRLFPKNYAFRKRALLGEFEVSIVTCVILLIVCGLSFTGSFEESLLQRRFEPKFLVPGYKVLLAASGCYCTNQITIPAYTFFYELNSETMSTPYVVSDEEDNDFFHVLLTIYSLI